MLKIKPMPVINRTIMPNKPLTNQELLTELQKRIQQGTIAWEVRNQVQADDPLTAQLFKVKVSKTEPRIKTQADEASDDGNKEGFNNTWLLIGLAAVAFYLIWKRSFTVRTEVDLVDKSPSSQMLKGIKYED